MELANFSAALTVTVYRNPFIARLSPPTQVSIKEKHKSDRDQQKTSFLLAMAEQFLGDQRNLEQYMKVGKCQVSEHKGLDPDYLQKIHDSSFRAMPVCVAPTTLQVEQQLIASVCNS